MSSTIGGSNNLAQTQYSSSIQNSSESTQAASTNRNTAQESALQDTVLLSAPARSAIKETPLPIFKNVEYAPQIKEGVSNLINKTNQLHGEGSGKIPLTDLVKSLGVELTPEDLKTLQARGDIKFNSTEGNSGNFSNSGKAAKVPYSGFQMKIPENISGKYSVTPNGLQISFADGHKIQAGKWGIYYDMENMAMNREQVNVDMKGDKFDQTIMLSPKPTK